MGAMIALLLVFSSLTGCASETLIMLQRSALTEAREAAAVFYTAELETLEGEQRDGAVRLAAWSYEAPVLRVHLEDGTLLETPETPEEEQALALAEAFNARFSEWREGSTHLRELEKDARTFRSEIEGAGGTFLPFTEELRCTVYQTEHFISVSGLYYSDTGGAHPNTMLLSWNFDLDTGAFFDPQMLAEEQGLRDAVYQELLAQAQEKAEDSGAPPEEVFWPDYAEILEDWSSYAVSFDEEGMTVAFSPYELACYAAGPQVFLLPYDVLRPHLSLAAQVFLGLA